MNALREECQQLRDELIALRREFHRAPELGLREYHTAARIERELDRCGIPHGKVLLPSTKIIQERDTTVGIWLRLEI